MQCDNSVIEQVLMMLGAGSLITMFLMLALGWINEGRNEKRNKKENANHKK